MINRNSGILLIIKTRYTAWIFVERKPGRRCDSFFAFCFLDFQARHAARHTLAVAIVSLVIRGTARPLRGVGIAVPMFVPPFTAAAVALLLVRDSAPVVAYVAGTLGMLIGADVLNFGRFRGLGAPVASMVAREALMGFSWQELSRCCWPLSAICVHYCVRSCCASGNTSKQWKRILKTFGTHQA